MRDVEEAVMILSFSERSPVIVDCKPFAIASLDFSFTSSMPFLADSEFQSVFYRQISTLS